MKNIKTISFATLILFCYMLAGAGSYYVATTGSDTNTGTSGAPYKTITKAVQMAVAGDTVTIRGGTYREGTIGLGSSGNAGNPIVFQGAPGESVEIKGSTVVTGWVNAGGTMWKATGMTINSQQVFVDSAPLQQIGVQSHFNTESYDGQTLLPPVGSNLSDVTTGCYYYDSGAKEIYCKLPDSSNPNNHFMEASVTDRLIDGNDKSYITLRNLTFRHSNGTLAWEGKLVTAGYSANMEGWTIEDCRFIYGDYTGLQMYGRNHVVRRSSFTCNGCLGLNVQGSGAEYGYAPVRSRPPQNILLEDLTLTGNNYRGFNYNWHGGGMKNIPSCRAVTVQRCYVANNFGHGIWFDYALGDILIQDNITINNKAGIFYEISGPCVGDSYGGKIYNNRVIGSAEQGIYVSASTGAIVQNNTLYNNLAGIVVHGKPRAESDLNNNDVKYNIIGGNGAWADLVVYIGAGSSGNKADYDFFARPVNPRVSVVTGSGYDVTHTNLAALFNETGFEEHGRTGDPLWINASNNDFRLQEGSPAKGFGWLGYNVSTVTVDNSPPSVVPEVRDGATAGIDMDSTILTTRLSANWTAATDAESGISNYQYAIGLTPGGSETAGWTTIGNVLTVTKTGLTLSLGATYYFSVKAVNGTGLPGNAANSNGQVVLPKVQELAGHWKMDETSGSSAADSSGKGNTGTLNSSPVWAPLAGKIGGSLSFDGTDDYVNYGTNGILDFPSGDGFTIAGWVKTTESYGPIISQRSSTDNGAIIEVAVGYDGVVTDAGKLMALVRQDAGGSGYARVTGGAVNNGAWRHFALKRNTNGSIELFLDGVSQGTISGAQSAGAITTDLRAIGSERRWVQDAYGTADQQYLNGSIDDVRVYNYALTTAEIQALASAAADTTAPGAPGTVRDGTGTTDINSTTSRTQLSANWTAATDSQSGISGYSYAIGTSAGATNITNWTALGNVLTVTKTGLNLSVGSTYYFSVKATNGAGLTGNAANSNGQVVLSTAVADTTAPSAPGTVRDGAVAGTDAGFTYSTTTLSANWTASTDNESGITNYQFSIGTTPGGTQTSGWATIGNVLSVTKTGLSLAVGTTYYFSVKATNGAGLTGSATNSNGQYVNAVNAADTTAPSGIAQVRDGNETGVDTDVTYLTDELSANWDAAADAESGISRYLYAIGTAPGATNITNWKDNGALTEVTETGLTLTVGTTYYFSVKAENGVGLQSSVTNSDGQLVLSMDSQGPLISNVTAQGITSSGVTITWETDEPSTSRVEYGFIASYGSLTGEYLGMDTAHSVALAGLLSETQYHFRVISRDYSGNESTSADFIFTTFPTPTEVTDIRTYPNPCDFRNGQVIKFKVGAAGSETREVKIYTMSGKLVRKVTGTTEISWDGTNDSGEKVSRGIYISKITDSDGNTTITKIAVVK